MAKFQVPNLENATPGFLVDQLAIVRAKMSVLKKLEEIYKTALNARTSDDDWAKGYVQGEKFQAEKNAYPRHAVDQGAVKDFADNPRVKALLLEELNIDVDELLFSDALVEVIRTSAIPGFDLGEVYGISDEDIFKDWGLSPEAAASRVTKEAKTKK